MYDVIIVGGGAAGYYAAIHIAQENPSLSIGIFERGKTVLGKVKISGGGRCNVTHAEFEPKPLSANYPRGEKELLGPFNQYAPGDVIEFFESRGVPLSIEGDGRMFPQSNSSQTIIDCFEGEAERLGIRVLKNTRVKDFSFLKDENYWQVTTQNKHYEAKILLLATGSNTKIWEQLNELGHRIIDPTPSLFTFNCKDYRLENNQGLSADAIVEVLPNQLNNGKAKRRDIVKLISEGPVLITHWGLSGPGILRLSAWGSKILHAMGYNFKIRVNWQPEHSYESFLGYLHEIKEQDPKKKQFLKPRPPTCPIGCGLAW